MRRYALRDDQWDRITSGVVAAIALVAFHEPPPDINSR
jgi:hypothetical protein